MPSSSQARELSSQQSSNNEVVGLLAFKKSSVQSDPNNLLASWSPNSASPCSWSGISCSLNGDVTTLNLTKAGLIGTLNLHSLTGALQSLKHLYLQGNSFSAADLSASPSCVLETLDLSSNNFSDPLPRNSFLESCIHLSYVNLSHNSIPGGTLRFGPSLLQLDLSHSPPSLKLSGNGFPSSLRNCGLLQTLNLSRNELQFKIPGALLRSFTNLRQLSLAHNLFYGDIPLELGQACGTLQELDLSANKLTGGLPQTFASCSSMRSLNLGNNMLSGEFLSTVVSKLQSLKYLYVPFNNITGTVPLSLANCSQLEVLDLSSNAFNGDVPSKLCSSSNPTALQKLLLADNYLSGKVPPELGSCKNLRSIDLSFNNLIGPIPMEVWTLPNLLDLVMWANNLTGKIPEGICVDGGNLETLILNNNLITGSIPQSIGNCTNMIWVSLSSNRLTGEIPAGIGNLVNLAVLQMGNNSLTGQIPPELGKCQSLIWLDLNSNNLTGPLPPELADQAGLVVPGTVSGKQFAFVRNEGGTSCRGAGGLVEFHGIRAERLENLPMAHSCSTTRIYSGMTVYTFTTNGSMIFLDLAYNSLSGDIPQKFGSMSYLQVLNLGHNKLTGNIPDSFGGLKAIGVLDLSHNDLQGFLPGYENNSGLCGVPLPPCSSGGHPESYNTRRKKQSVEVGMVIGITFFILCVFGLAMAFYRVKKYQQKEEQREKYIESLPTSGKKPIDSAEFGDDNNLVGWAKQLYREKRCNEILDPELMTQTSGESKLYQYLRIAFECLDDRPFRRPTMIQVMAMFKELQVDSESDILDGLSLKDASIDEFKEESSS
ncbi:hypothetical protein OIU76_025900 [Salix suchowensis]|nr:hypothetical protein OIU76_025900 [Salix suchowensis]